MGKLTSIRVIDSWSFDNRKQNFLPITLLIAVIITSIWIHPSLPNFSWNFEQSPNWVEGISRGHFNNLQYFRHYYNRTIHNSRLTNISKPSVLTFSHCFGKCFLIAAILVAILIPSFLELSCYPNGSFVLGTILFPCWLQTLCLVHMFTCPSLNSLGLFCLLIFLACIA